MTTSCWTNSHFVNCMQHLSGMVNIINTCIYVHTHTHTHSTYMQCSSKHTNKPSKHGCHPSSLSHPLPPPRLHPKNQPEDIWLILHPVIHNARAATHVAICNPLLAHFLSNTLLYVTVLYVWLPRHQERPQD